MKRALLFGALLHASGCGIVEISGCDDIRKDGVSVKVIDVRTGLPALTDSVVIEASDGSYRDTVQIIGNPNALTVPIGLAPERSGTYAITVNAKGYLGWQQKGIRVGDSGCHVETERVVALLEKR